MLFRRLFMMLSIVLCFAVSKVGFSEEMSGLSATFEETPFVTAVAFSLDGEGYTAEYGPGLDEILVSGIFYGDTVEELVSNIALVSGVTVTVNGTNIIFQ